MNGPAMLFADNDRPGIMLAERCPRSSSIATPSSPGVEIAFVTSGAWLTARPWMCLALGLLSTIVDLRPGAFCGSEVTVARKQGIEVLTEHTAIGSQGRKAVSGLVVAPVNVGKAIGHSRVLPCDVVSGFLEGGRQLSALHSQSRGKLLFNT